MTRLSSPAATAASTPATGDLIGGCRGASIGTVAREDFFESAHQGLARDREHSAAAIAQAANLRGSSDAGGLRPRCSERGVLRIIAHRSTALPARSTLR